MVSPARLYYFYIEPIVLHSKKQQTVFLIGDIFQVYKHNYCKINKNTFTHVDLQIPVDSIKDYRDIHGELNTILLSYRGWTMYDVDDTISDVDKERIIKLRQQLDEIENEWTKKADAFLAWKRRRQLVTIWTQMHADI